MKRMMGQRHGRRAFALLELVMMLAVMAVVAMLLTQLIAMMMRTTKASVVRDTMIHRVDTALEALRRDVWSATAIRTGSAAADRVELQEMEGVVVWQMGKDGKLTRRAGAALPRVWVGMPAFGFSAGGARLTVGVDSGPPGGAKHETVMLVSQQMLAGGGT